MSRTRWSSFAVAIALAVCVFLAFRPALDARFLDWDDDLNFVRNPKFRGLDAEHLRWMFTTFHMGPYQPLSWLTLGIDHAWHGMDPAGYHLTNVLFHAAAVVMTLLAARRLFAAVRPAWSARTTLACAACTAFVFGVHPLRVESVAWVTERRDVVSGAFLACTLWFWFGAEARGPRRAGAYALALASFLCALLSKATVVGLPLALWVLDVWPLGRWKTDRRRVLLDLAPFAVLSVVFALVAVAGQASTGTALKALGEFGLAQRVAQAAYSCVFYPWKTLVPTGLSPIYDVPSPFDPFAARFVVAAAVFVAACVVAWALRRRAPAFTAAWVAFLVLVAPVSGLVSAGPQLVADRYSYVACVPFAFALAAGLGVLIERAGSRSRRMALIVVVVIAGLASSVATHAQTRHWHDTRTLWEHAYAVDPTSAVANAQLGVVRVTQSQAPGLDAFERARLLEEALGLYTRAYQTAPHPQHVFNIAGLVLQRAELLRDARAEQMQVAVETFEEGLRFARETTGVLPAWRVMYANALVEVGRLDDARRELDEVLRVDPDNVGAHLWMSRIESEQGHPDEARRHLETVLRVQPENETARRALLEASRPR